MKKIAVLCKEGFEEIEALTPVDILRRAGVMLFSRNGSKGDNKFSSNYDKMDCLFNENLYQYDGIVIPGGLPGATNLRDDDRVIEIVKDFYEKGKLVSAICAGPIVLAKADILNGKVCTCSPGFEDQLNGANYQEAIVQRDGNVITGKGPAAALEFGYTILETLGYDASNLRQGMQYNYLINVEATKASKR